MNASAPLMTILFIALFCISAHTAKASFFFPFSRRCFRNPVLTCALQPTAGQTVSGVVTLRPVLIRENNQRICVVKVTAQLTGLTPGLHGIHIHTYGDVRAMDGTAAGGHFANPRGSFVPHGWPDSELRHWGDFGNLTANANGDASFSHLDRVVTIPGIVGRAMIVHAENDKGPMFQPSGASGARQAQCVIGIANPALVR